MLRNRLLSASGSKITLVTHFIPSESDDMSAEFGVVGISYDLNRVSYPIQVFRYVIPSGDSYKTLRNTYGSRYPLPSLPHVKEELDYMFNLINSLAPYETQTQISQDFSPLQD